MAAIQFYSGDTETINYTPGADVPAGTTVTIGSLVGVTHRPIKAGEMGALHLAGGVYLGVGDAVIAAGTPIYFDPGTGKFTATAGALKKFGCTTTACAGNGLPVYVLHVPNNA